MHVGKTKQYFMVGEYTLSIGGLKAHICEGCGGKLFSYETTQLIQSAARAFSYAFLPMSDILNLREVAKVMRVSNQTVYNMIKDKRLKAYKAGREWRIKKSDVECLR